MHKFLKDHITEQKSVIIKVMVDIKRKICFPITSRVHYARQKQLLSLLNKDSRFELQVVAGGSVLSEKYGEMFANALLSDGFEVKDALYNLIDGGGHVAMAKTASLVALEFVNTLHKLNSDIVLIRGDRYEQLAIAMVAAYLNKTIAHIEGGDSTGTIDESVRHAITKLAHIHFVTNEDAKRRVIKMGENPKYVFNVGSPDVEFVATVPKSFDGSMVNKIGVGTDVDLNKDFVIVMYHPVTTESHNRKNTEALLEIVDKINVPAVWFWPNHDAGTNEIAKAIRVFRESGKIRNNKIRFVTDLLPEDFVGLLRRAKVLVGNSSAGIKECSYLGVPVVNIGSRQQGRLRGPNVLDADNDPKEIKQAITKQLKHGPYKRSDVYFKPDTSKNIVSVLSKFDLYTQKKFYES